MPSRLNIALFVHAIRSDWNNGNAHFLRGLARALGSYEPPEEVTVAVGVSGARSHGFLNRRRTGRRKTCSQSRVGGRRWSSLRVCTRSLMFAVTS